jgi:hypothetical protein
MIEVDIRVEQAAELADKLERLSADSYWAHQASGVRGSLLRWLAAPDIQSARWEILMQRGYHLLENAARELPFEEVAPSSKAAPSSKVGLSSKGYHTEKP